LESLPLSNDQTGQYVGNEATTLALSTISAVIGFLTASCVFYTKSIIFGVNRSTLTRFPHIMPIVAGASVMLLIKTEPNVKKPPKLWLGEEQSRDAYKVMWRQLLLRWIGAIISIGGGAALGTAGMSAEIGILITYLLLVVVRPTLQITPAQQRMLLLAASAAGAAANFNAPITGVIYALEVTSKLLPGSTSTSLEKDDHKKKLLLLMTCATLFATLCIRSGYFVPPFKSSLDWGIGLGTDYNALQALVTYGVLGVLSGGLSERNPDEFNGVDFKL
jgi:H+/Cl- antiporter ClcA